MSVVSLTWVIRIRLEFYPAGHARSGLPGNTDVFVPAKVSTWSNRPGRRLALLSRLNSKRGNCGSTVHPPPSHIILGRIVFPQVDSFKEFCGPPCLFCSLS